MSSSFVRLTFVVGALLAELAVTALAPGAALPGSGRKAPGGPALMANPPG